MVVIIAGMNICLFKGAILVVLAIQRRMVQ
jgi:hypothetical protein